MRYIVNHALSYHYSRPVTLDSHTIRIKPRPDARQQVHRFEMSITPTPSYTTRHIDPENNLLTTAWFEGSYELLQISACSEVETSDRNPYDFMLTDTTPTNLPIVYKEPDKSLLNIYTIPDKESLETLGDFLKPVLIQAKYETVPFLNGFVTYILSKIKRRERKYGNPLAPEKTLQKGIGSCRDTAWLFVTACRSLGLAARFVSGYHVPFNPRKKPDLHAWAEVFLPGAGWIGFDPSLGLAVSERHIALAASYDPALTLPTIGSFWGKDVKAVLRTTINIKSLE